MKELSREPIRFSKKDLAKGFALVLLSTTITACFKPPTPKTYADTDADGYTDNVDNCVQVANGVNEDDQLDTDLDGRGDACDGAAFPEAGFEYADDFDNDGISTLNDSCPTVYDVNNNPDVCADDDADGVVNAEDACPNDDRTTDNAEYCTDSDFDGVVNIDDVCPNEDRTSTDAQYCTDDDADTVVNADDNCPLVANGSQANIKGGLAAGDACEDQDADGFMDADDLCANSFDTVNDGASCAIPDSDGDGANDNDDLCPADPNTTNDPEYCVNDNDGDTVYNFYDVCPDDNRTSTDSEYCSDDDGDNIVNVDDSCPTVYDVSNSPASCECSPQQLEVTYDLRATWSNVSGTPLGAGDNAHMTFGARADQMRATLRFEDTNGDGAANDNSAVELVYLYINQDFTVNNSGLTVVTYYDNTTADARYTSEADSSELTTGSATGSYNAATGTITWDGLGVNSSFEGVEANIDDYETVGSISCSGGGFFVTCGSVTEVNCTAGACVERLALKDTTFNNAASPYFYTLSRTSNTSRGDANADTRMTSNPNIQDGAGTAAPTTVTVPDNGFCN